MELPARPPVSNPAAPMAVDIFPALVVGYNYPPAPWPMETPHAPAHQCRSHHSPCAKSHGSAGPAPTSHRYVIYMYLPHTCIHINVRRQFAYIFRATTVRAPHAQKGLRTFG